MKKIVSLLLMLVCAGPLYGTTPTVLNHPISLSETALLEGEKAINMRDFLGKPVILLYGAHWCPACHKAMPALDGASEEYAAAGVHMNVVRTATSKEYKSMTTTSLHLSTLGDDGAVLRNMAGIKVFPTFLFINGEGKLVAKSEGSPAWNTVEMRAFMTDFLSPSKSLSPSQQTWWQKVIATLKGPFS